MTVEAERKVERGFPLEVEALRTVRIRLPSFASGREQRVSVRVPLAAQQVLALEAGSARGRASPSDRSATSSTILYQQAKALAPEGPVELPGLVCWEA